MSTPVSTPPIDTTGFDNVTDTLGKLAQIPGIDNLKGILEGLNLGLGAQSHAVSGVGDLNITGVGQDKFTTLLIWVALAGGAFLVWKKYG